MKLTVAQDFREFLHETFRRRPNRREITHGVVFGWFVAILLVWMIAVPLGMVFVGYALGAWVWWFIIPWGAFLGIWIMFMIYYEDKYL